MFFISPLPQSALVALRLGRARGPRRAACALRAPQRPKRTARVLLGALSRPYDVPTHHPHAMPDRSGQRTAAKRTPHRTVRRTWRSTRRPRRRGPARRARPREVGSRRCGRERRCVPRGRGRVLHTVCPTQRRNERCAGGAGSGAPRRARASRKGRRGTPLHPRTPAERTGPARAPRPASQSPESKICGRWRGQLTRTSFGGSLCRARAWGSARARTTTPPCTPARPPSASGPARGASPCLVDPTFTKSGKVGKGS